ncbi:MAG: YfhO family protein, partial [Anaerolineae bacterium]
MLHPPLPDLSQIAPPNSPPQVEIVRQQANELAISVTTASPGLLVLSEWAYPGWRATVDGRAATLYPANYAFQALLLPTGTHQISLRFLPVDVIAGGITALVTLLAAAFLAWRWQPIINNKQKNIKTKKRKNVLFPFQSLIINPSIRLKISLQAFSWPQKQWGILLLILLGFGLRVFRLGHQELRGDEAFSYLYASHPAANIVGDLLRVGDTHSPLHYFLLHGWLKLTGDSEFALRFLSLIPAVLTIAMLY